MRVVVTGGAGFIGANLCRALSEGTQGAVEVVALDDLSTGSADNLTGTATTLVVGSILDRQLLQQTAQGADAIVHLAARPSVSRSIEDPISTHDVNVTGTAYVLEAARDVGAQVIMASSSSVYGSTRELPKHEDLPTRPLSPYGASKLAGEAYALAWGSAFGMPVLAFRFFNVYGPLQAAGHAYAAVIPAFIDAALDGRPLPVFGDGKQTRDFTYVGTVCNVIADAVQRRLAHPLPVNLALGTRVSLLELITMLEEKIGRALEVVHHPTRQGDIRDSQASATILRELFPAVDAVPLADGLDATLNWFQQTKPKSARSA